MQPVECPKGCGIQGLLKKDLERHTRVIKCQYKCGQPFLTKCTIEAHEVNYHAKHVIGTCIIPTECIGDLNIDS